MPRDKHGNIADLVRDGFPQFNRMIPAQSWEHHLQATAMQIERELRNEVNLNDKSSVFRGWEKLKHFYKYAAPLDYIERMKYVNDEYDKIYEDVKSVITDKLFFYLPHSTPGIGEKLIDELDRQIPLDVGKVSWVGEKGTVIKSKDDVMIGANYMIFLEKTSHEWSAVDSAKRQIHGLPAKVNEKIKMNLPYAPQMLKTFGESEVRSFSGTIGEWITADMMDRPNNPDAQRAIFKTILEALKPTNIDSVIDRNKIPIGRSLSLQYIENALMVSGAQLAYKPVDTDAPSEFVLNPKDWASLDIEESQYDWSNLTSDYEDTEEEDLDDMEDEDEIDEDAEDDE